MEKIKVSFLSWHFQTPEIFLNSILKMTPNCSGKWKNMTAILDPFKADFTVIMDGYGGKFPEDRAIYIGEHPNCLASFKKWETKTALLKLSLDRFLNPGEFWINYDYNYLSNLKPPQKIKDLICIMTYQTHTQMYRNRQEFMAGLMSAHPNLPLDLYGRPEENFKKDKLLSPYYRGCLGKNNPDGTRGEHLIGKEILINYRYSLEFDVGKTINYFSERFYDSLLLWCMPIYFGSTNVHQYIPEKAFHYVDIENRERLQYDKVYNVVNSDSREQNLSAIEEARYLLLNKYQLWAYIYDVITNLDKYR